MSQAESYSTAEWMASIVASQIRNDDVVFIGVGIPLIAGIVAVSTHAPGAILVYEGGGIGARTRRIPWTISDNPTTDNALAATQMWRVFGDQQRGFITLGIIGGAEIDRFGNLNTTAIFGPDGSYLRPKVRLPGSGGANDIASSALRTVIMMRLEKGKFVERVHFVTSPGYLTGPGEREKAGLSGKGPVMVVTDRCVFGFDEVTKEMTLTEVFPGVRTEEIRNLVGWDLKVSPGLKQVEPPLPEQIRAMRTFDSMGFVLNKKGAGSRYENFDEFCRNVQAAYESIRLDD
ncbi:MAG TPA: CoA-transferase [Thermodesulfobacteriota bacterium]|nr:CoA-transferase [Thermodesulfobacteriota bacterium]